MTNPNDLIRRGDAVAALSPRLRDMVSRSHACGIINAIPAAPDTQYMASQERNYLHLHQAAYDVWRWFEVSRPDLIGPRAEALRDAVNGPRPYGSLPAAPDTPEVLALVEALRYYAVEAMPWDADDSLVARTAIAAWEASRDR